MAGQDASGTATVRFHGTLERQPFWMWTCPCGETGILIASQEEAQREADEHTHRAPRVSPS